MDLTNEDVTDEALEDMQQAVDAGHRVKREGRAGERAAAASAQHEQLLVRIRRAHETTASLTKSLLSFLLSNSRLLLTIGIFFVRASACTAIVLSSVEGCGMLSVALVSFNAFE